MYDDNVLNLVDKTSSALSWSIKDALKKAVSLREEKGDNYTVGYLQAGMKSNQCVALCEISKSIFKSSMGYNDIGEDDD